MQNARLRKASAAFLLTWLASACAGSGVPSSTVPYSTEQSVGAVVSAPLAKAGRSATEAFRSLGIQLIEVEIDEAAHKYSGTRRGLDITAELKSQPAGLTQVEVTARAGDASFDKVFAQKVLERIAGKLD
jgi:hypothetical protein